MKVENLSRFKKDRFLKSLTEDDFRDRAIRPLMLRSGYSDGRDLCGPSSTEKIQSSCRRISWGLQQSSRYKLQRGILTLLAQLQRNLLDAITQLKTALETPIVLLSKKQSAEPNRGDIYAASGKINDAARQYIFRLDSESQHYFLGLRGFRPNAIDQHLPRLWFRDRG